MDYSKKEFEKHLKEEHKLTTISEYLKEIVYGGNDGIVTTFAVVAGFTGASAGAHISTISPMMVLLFGFANLFGDGVAMGLGNFLSIRSQKEIYKNHQEKELKEIRGNPEMEKVETIHILKSKGFSQEDAQEMAKLYTKNEKYWLEFMMNQELEMPNPEDDNPWLTALATFLSFIFFGFIPLFPYFVIKKVDGSFLLSALSAFLALVLLGVLRWKVSKESILKSVGEVVLVGGISATVAFVVGTFFRA